MHTKIATTLIVGALLTPAAGFAAEKSMTHGAKEAVSDSAITTKIKAEFAKDKMVSAMHVKVDTDNKGVVTLSGNAKSKAEADHAVKLAHDTKGVTSVKNDIVIGDAGGKAMTHTDKTMTQSVKENVGDAVITTKIKAEFAKDKMVSAMHIKVDTDDKGVVTLSGNAKSKAESDQAVRIARDTKGVTSVKNDITVQAK
ncbi:MAG: BON domain-containing protein [Burkholderiales bacterium]